MADVFDTLTPDKPQAAARDVFDQLSPQPGTSVNKSTPGDVFDTVEYQEDKADPFRGAGQATSLSAGPNIHAWDALKSGEFMEFYNRAKNWLSAAGEDVANGTNQTSLGSLLQSMGSHGTRDAQMFSEEMRDQVLGTTPKTPTQRVIRSIGRKVAGAVTAPLDWVPDVLQGTTRAAKAVPGALEATGATIEGDTDKSFHSTVGAFNDLVGGGFQAITPIISVMYPGAAAEKGLAALGPELAKTGTTLASAMGMQFVGQTLAADMGADEDVQEAVGNVFGLATFKAFHTLFSPTDFEKFGHQFNDYTNSEQAYKASAQELSVQREQVKNAQAVLDQTMADAKAGTVNRQQVVAAQQAVSEASASALKAQKKFEMAGAARSKSKVELEKTTKNIERLMEKERQKANGRNGEVAQVATDTFNKFNKAVPSTGNRQYTQEDYEVWRNYAEPHHENVDPIMSVKDVAESAEVEREQLENDARSKVHGEDFKDQPLQDTEGGNEALDHVRRSLAERDSVQPGFADRAISYLQEKFNTTDLTLSEADKLRAEINRLNRAKLKESGWNISDAMASDTNFAAREALNDYLKETIEQRLQDLGVDGVRENRMDQASLVRIRNAAEGILNRNSRAGEVMVRGTGENSRGRRAVSWVVKRLAQGGGAALGAEIGGPGGAAFGAATGGMLSEPLLEKILRPNLTRDQLIASIMEGKDGTPIKVATGSPAQIRVGATPGAPPAAPMPPVPPEPTPYEARDKDLHGDMMTYFDKRPGQDGASYPELVQMVKDEMDIYQKHGVKSADRPQALNDLANRITKEELAEDLERNKEARDRAAKKAEKAATVESVAQEATGKKPEEMTPADKAKLSTEQAAAAAAIPSWDWKELFPFKYSDTELEVPQNLWGNKSFDPFFTRIHELAHVIANLKIGAPPIDVQSHIGTKGESWANARADISRFENEDGSTNMDVVRANMGGLLTRFVIGGVAEQIHGGERFDANSTLSTDLANAKEMLNALEIPEARQNELMRSAIQQAHEWLTEKGVKELMETYARKRIADTPDTHHFTEEHIKAFSDALGKLVGGDYEPTEPESGKKTSGKGLARVQPATGEGREGAASGREGQAAQDLDVRKSVPEAKVGGKAEKSLVERTVGSEAEDRAIKAGGGIPAGTTDFGGGHVVRLFHDPENGSTLGFAPGEKVTPEAVKERIAENRAKYAAGEARQKLGTEKAAPGKMRDGTERLSAVHPTEDEYTHDRVIEPMLQKFGTTENPREARFLTPSGEMMAGPKDEHMRMAHYGTDYDREMEPDVRDHEIMMDSRKEGEDFTTAYNREVGEARRYYLEQALKSAVNDARLVRVGFRTGRGGPEAYFSVPKDGVTAEQVENMRRVSGSLGRNGNVMIERADIKPETKDKLSRYKEFARPTDIDTMLREIEAAPKVKLGTEQAIPQEEADKNYQKYLEAQKAAEEKEVQNKKAFKLETGISKAAPETAPHVVEGANRYNKKQGRAEVNPETKPLDEAFSKRVADAYDAMQHNPNDPAVKKSYDAMAKEVRQQWDHAVNDMGMKFEPWTKEGQPYANSKEMVRDVRDNKHLYFFRGGDFSADNPMANKVDPETGFSPMEMFRAVHDLFGHAAHGNEFGPKGEEKAYQLHRQMFSPEAIPALTSETRGQNSWVNFGKHLRTPEGNIPAKGEPGFVPQTQRPYAEQKVGLLPSELHTEAPGIKGNWADDVAARLKNESAGGINPNNPEAPSARYGLEVLPEARQPHESDLTADHFRSYADRPEVKDALGKHPNVKLGWDTGGEKPELNVGASTDDKQAALDVAKKLDQRALWDNEKKEEVPVGGEGKKTSFPDYPLDQRLKDLNLSTEKAALKENEKLEPVGLHEDDLPRRAKYQDVDFSARDLQDSEKKVTPETILKDYAPDAGEKGYARDKNVSVYKAYIPMENLPSAQFGEPEEDEDFDPADFDREEYSRPRVGVPIKVVVHKDGSLGILDGNHRAQVWEEQGQQYAPAWVVDRRGANIEQLSEDEKLEREEGLNVGRLEKAKEENPDVVSTAVPFGKNAIADPHTEHVRVGMDSIPEKPMAKIAARVREVPGIKIPENIKDPSKVVNRYIDQAKDNLKYMYNKVPAEKREANAKWYESANRIADRISNDHGKTVRQGAGVLAAMSPQKDWNMNVGLAERTMNIYHEQANESLSPEAQAKAGEIGLGGMVARIGDRKLSELTEPLEKAAFVRIWDETHNDRSFRHVDPATGNYGDVVKTEDGEPYKIAWGSLNEIAKAISIIEDGSRENISRVLGMGHKVRNFYNNIIDPNNAGGHVTVDTHAVAAAQMRPLGGKDPDVLFHFGRLSAAQTGLRGMYPVNAEAYRRAAAELGIQPRQLQSVVWEEGRGNLFPAELKKDPAFREAIDGIWEQYEDGKISIDKARDSIYETSAKFKAKNTEDKAAGRSQSAFDWLAKPSFANISGQGGPVMQGAADALSGRK